MIIVHVIPSFTGGGAERFVISLCNNLSNKGIETHIISLFSVNDNMFLHKTLTPDVQVHFLNKKIGLDIKIFGKLYKLIKKIQPNVVNTHVRAFNYNYLNLIFNNKPKYYHTVHNDALVECPSKINRSIRKFFLRQKVKPITISKQSSQSFQKTYRLFNDKIINNGREAIIPTEKINDVINEIGAYKINEDTIVFLNIANLLPVKGHVNLVKAFSKVIEKKERNAILLLIGDRREGDETIYSTIKAYSSKNIIYLGKKINVEDYLFCSNAFVLSSSVEGMPIVVLEAMASDCVPIVTPVGGVVDMIQHLKNGLIADSFSKEDLYHILEYYMSMDSPSINALKKGAKESFDKKYTIEKSASEYLKLYQ